ncbi:MAG: protein translocase subunit SecD [Parvularculaceae bacterium]
MLQFSKWQTAMILLTILFGAYFSAPNFFGKTSDGDERSVPGFIDSRVTLGLDLQGGSYMLLSVNTDKVVQKRLTSSLVDVRNAMRGRGNDAQRRITLQSRGIELKEDTITVKVKDADRYQEALTRLKELSRPVGNLIGGAGVRDFVIAEPSTNIITLTMPEEAKRFYAQDGITASIEGIRRRIDSVGTTEPLIQRQGDDRIIIQVPGDDDPERLKRLLVEQGELSFHMVDLAASIEDAVAGKIPPRRMLMPNREGGPLVIEQTPFATGDMIKNASATPNNDGGGFQVNFSFDNRGTLRMRKITSENIGRVFAIVLDGEIVSAPRIQSPIPGGSGRITGNFTPEEGLELAILIKSGALPAELTPIEQRSVGADLGEDSIRAGAIALGIGFVAVFIFMVIAYGRFGVYADLALLANVVLLLGCLSLLGATLTLPGIAGIVLTIGMAVDANVLIFERIREEVRAGKAAVQAVETGYRKAWSAIIDANITTFLACAIMFFLGAGPVRGFSVTLGIGVITSVFTAYVLTRLMAGGYVLKHRPAKLAL